MLYFESETVLKFYNLKARPLMSNPGPPIFAATAFVVTVIKDLT